MDGGRFEIRWIPFILNQRIPEKGFSLTEYFTQVYGAGMLKSIESSKERLVQIGQHLSPPINFDFSKDPLVMPTIHSHRLVEWSKLQGKQDGIDSVVMDVLFSEHYENHMCLGDLDKLADCAAKAGLDREKALAFLKSDQLLHETLALDKEWRRRYPQVTGTPFVIMRVEGSTVERHFSGAQQAETIVAYFKQMRKKAAQEKQTQLSTGKCVVCGNPSKQRCSKCKQAKYCSRDCQAGHWSEHKQKCVNNADQQQDIAVEGQVCDIKTGKC